MGTSISVDKGGADETEEALPGDAPADNDQATTAATAAAAGEAETATAARRAAEKLEAMAAQEFDGLDEEEEEKRREVARLVAVIPPAIRKRTEAMFKRTDEDGDGVVTETLLLHVLKSVGHTMDRTQVRELIGEAPDVEENDAFTLDETLQLVALVNPQKKSSRMELREVFQRYDFDGDGYISARDLRNAYDEDYTEEQIQDLIQLTDMDGDGKIGFEEFCRMIVMRE